MSQILTKRHTSIQILPKISQSLPLWKSTRYFFIPFTDIFKTLNSRYLPNLVESHVVRE